MKPFGRKADGDSNDDFWVQYILTFSGIGLSVRIV